jgi:hypothetical protein
MRAELPLLTLLKLQPVAQNVYAHRSGLSEVAVPP